MQRNHFGGRFIVFEGLNGSGKTKQVELLAGWLSGQNNRVLVTKEPSSSVFGDEIRRVLAKQTMISPINLQKLFAKDREIHLQKEIIPALKHGKVVLCDRYFMSSLAFGGIDVSMTEIARLNNNFLYPDMVFYLRVAPAICAKRIRKRGNGLRLFEEIKKMGKVADNYEKLATQLSRIISINGEQGIDETHREILSRY